jgi:lipid kinase YegS
MLFVILNGKKLDIPEVRDAIYTLREEGYRVEVRVTWEYGDGIRYVKEASDMGADTVVSAGGDGTLNEVVNALMRLDIELRPSLAILPLGTANDFATACEIPEYPLEALRLAIEAKDTEVDCIRANDRYFINVATGGIGATITAQTPTELKNFLGGGAYTLSAVVMALSNISSNPEGKLVGEGIEIEGRYIAAAICNGRQAGGGQVLAPHAYINDGLFDIVIILEFPLSAVAQVIREVLDDSIDGEYIKRYKTSKVYSSPKESRSINLDGEPYLSREVEFDLVAKSIRLKLPKNSPLIKDI